MYTTLWEFLGGWTFVDALAVFAAGTGFSVMSMSPPEFAFAKAGFTVAGVLFTTKFASWLIQSDGSLLQRAIYSAIVFGLLGLGWSESWRWVSVRQRVFFV